ncbi:hypothetical protein QIA37_04930 (plasmid) [Borrelia sp. CA_690]|uniref:hypothetical protein n=1 Tax=Borrelia sp. CA_690 TaxID=2419518 RepID=UPI003AB885DF
MIKVVIDIIFCFGNEYKKNNFLNIIKIYDRKQTSKILFLSEFARTLPHAVLTII